jgi:hypothetical protein
MGIDLNGNKIYSASIGPKGEAIRKIVIENLGLYLDAANKNSYSGTGTAWNDLASGGYTATMYGSVPTGTDVTTYFDFSSVGGSSAAGATLGFTFAGNPLSTTENFTISCWIKNPPTSAGQTGLFANAGGGDGYRFGVGLNGIYYLIGPTYQEGGISFLSTLNTTSWYHVCAVYNRTGTLISVYLNGVFQNSNTIPAQSAYSAGIPGLVRSACCSLYTGKLATFYVHNKALSATEIAQNYNAQKARFGL